MYMVIPSFPGKILGNSTSGLSALGALAALGTEPGPPVSGSGLLALLGSGPPSIVVLGPPAARGKKTFLLNEQCSECYETKRGRRK